MSEAIYVSPDKHTHLGIQVCASSSQLYMCAHAVMKMRLREVILLSTIHQVDKEKTGERNSQESSPVGRQGGVGWGKRRASNEMEIAM